MFEASSLSFPQVWTHWENGGWLMLPLWLVTFFIYYTAFELLLWLNRHFLVRHSIHRMDDSQLRTLFSNPTHGVSLPPALFVHNALSNRDIKRHFLLVRETYLPPIDRRLRFLAIIITTSPLLGLLGTVTGMLSTFNGLASHQGNKFEQVVQGISEALITTQTGLIVAIPGMILLAILWQRRFLAARSIARLESFNTRQWLHPST